MSETVRKNRRRFDNLQLAQIARYRMPLAGLISILHRISGALLFLALPFILYLLERSLTSEDTFAHFKGIVSYWYVKLLLLAMAWAYLHHFCAGIRHLIMDMHIGLTKDAARHSSVAVFAVSLPLTALVALKLLGAF
jgi:succinate dehydrogenase / fumarate reductase cytochrome b subunit